MIDMADFTEGMIEASFDQAQRAAQFMIGEKVQFTVTRCASGETMNMTLTGYVTRSNWGRNDNVTIRVSLRGQLLTYVRCASALTRVR